MPLSRHRHNLLLLVGYGSFRMQDKVCIVGLLDPLWIGARCVPKRERERAGSRYGITQWRGMSGWHTLACARAHNGADWISSSESLPVPTGRERDKYTLNLNRFETDSFVDRQTSCKHNKRQ
jgi:hypothetical protein